MDVVNGERVDPYRPHPVRPGDRFSVAHPP
jgi:hypothetical protein